MWVDLFDQLHKPQNGEKKFVQHSPGRELHSVQQYFPRESHVLQKNEQDAILCLKHLGQLLGWELWYAILKMFTFFL